MALRQADATAGARTQELLKLNGGNVRPAERVVELQGALNAAQHDRDGLQRETGELRVQLQGHQQLEDRYEGVVREDEYLRSRLIRCAPTAFPRPPGIAGFRRGPVNGVSPTTTERTIVFRGARDASRWCRRRARASL